MDKHYSTKMLHGSPLCESLTGGLHFLKWCDLENYYIYHDFIFCIFMNYIMNYNQHLHL